MEKNMLLNRIVELKKHKNVNLSFKDLCSGDKVSKVERIGTHINLYLFVDDLARWESVIDETFSLLNEIEAELIHESKSPNFVKSVMASVELLKFS